MTEYATILATTDFSEESLAAVREARRLAQALGSKVRLLYVVEDRLPPVIDSQAARQVLEEHRGVAKESLDTFAAKHLEGVSHSTVVREGRPHDEITAEAQTCHASLVCIASHGWGLVGQMIFGSTTERVLRHAPCPVVVVHSRGGGSDS